MNKIKSIDSEDISIEISMKPINQISHIGENQLKLFIFNRFLNENLKSKIEPNKCHSFYFNRELISTLISITNSNDFHRTMELHLSNLHNQAIKIINIETNRNNLTIEDGFISKLKFDIKLQLS